jgi:hypothetical protein
VLCVAWFIPYRRGEWHMGDVFFLQRSLWETRRPTRIMKPCTGIGSSTSVDFYFSRTRRIKMDMNNSETKQGAVVNADVLQQKPYAEVIPT